MIYLPESLIQRLLLTQLLTSQCHVESHKTSTLGSIFSDLTVSPCNLETSFRINFLTFGFDILSYQPISIPIFYSLSSTYQALGVFTNDEHIKFTLIRESRRLDRSNRAYIGVKIKFLTKSNNGR